ncbi:nucleolar 11 [Pelobates cultripes]|uniref:Nucleolar 11 n=2 Tax=Pelobates cultripes TaxID=61616 RepID=A0AAD1W788_PELCU|nr:nucleolar 11 [Pelobates cultripes]
MTGFGEEFTLCALLAGTGAGRPRGPRSVGLGGEPDTVLLTDTGRTVTLYQVSDQKPLGSWTVKQGQIVTSPAVFNFGTEEYIVVHDDKVIRIWKDSNANLDKAFKATLSADVYRIHSLPDHEPLVLFRGGSVRFLDMVLADPQQEVETTLVDGEKILWSDMYVEGGQSVLVYITEILGEHCVYIWSSSPGISQKYKVNPYIDGSRTLGFSGSLKNKTFHLIILYSNGHVCHSFASLVQSKVENALTVSPLLQLEEPSDTGVVAVLDDSHIATLTELPSMQKDILCIWNTKFQTLQAVKEFSQKTSMQLWCHDNKMYVVHGKSITVIPYGCDPSCLASSLGKWRNIHTSALETVSFVNWDTLVDNAPEAKKSNSGGRKSARQRKTKPTVTDDADLAVLLKDIQNAPESQIASVVQRALWGYEAVDFHITIGKIMQELLNRCRCDPNFYPQSPLVQLIQTNLLSYSLCPDLVALSLEKQDVRLLQLCLQHLPDIPESVICSCLKAFLSVGEDHLRNAPLSTEYISNYIEVAEEAEQPSVPDAAVIQNGFSPAALEEDSCDVQTPEIVSRRNEPPKSPVSVKRAVLLNSILTYPYSETFLLPHLKSLSASQVVLFLRYLHYLYVKCGGDLTINLPEKQMPSTNQIMDWMSVVLDAHFTVVVMLPEAKKMLQKLHKFVRTQMKLYSELNKVEGCLSELHRMKHQVKDCDRYSIEVLELY